MSCAAETRMSPSLVASAPTATLLANRLMLCPTPLAVISPAPAFAPMVPLVAVRVVEPVEVRESNRISDPLVIAIAAPLASPMAILPASRLMLLAAVRLPPLMLPPAVIAIVPAWAVRSENPASPVASRSIALPTTTVPLLSILPASALRVRLPAILPLSRVTEAPVISVLPPLIALVAAAAPVAVIEILSIALSVPVAVTSVPLSSWMFEPVSVSAAKAIDPAWPALAVLNASANRSIPVPLVVALVRLIAPSASTDISSPADTVVSATSPSARIATSSPASSEPVEVILLPASKPIEPAVGVPALVAAEPSAMSCAAETRMSPSLAVSVAAAIPLADRLMLCPRPVVVALAISIIFAASRLMLPPAVRSPGPVPVRLPVVALSVILPLD